MGVLIIANGASAPWNSKVVLPVMRGLEGYFTFDTDSSRFSFNRAPGKDNALMSGSPLAFASHGRFNGQMNYLSTKIAETVEQTIIVVGKAASPVIAGAPPEGQPNYVSNSYGTGVNPPYVGIVATGVSLYHPDNARMSGAGARDNGSGAATSGAISLTATPADQWAIRAVRVSGSGFNVVKDLTAGTTATGSSSTTRVLNNKVYSIGGKSIGDSALVDISAVAIYSAALIDSEIALVADVMRKRMLRLGIVV